MKKICPLLQDDCNDNCQFWFQHQSNEKENGCIIVKLYTRLDELTRFLGEASVGRQGPQS